MANNVQGLSEMLRELAYYQGGGRPEGGRDIDKVNSIFGTVEKGVTGYQDIIKNVLANKKAELANKEEQLKQTPVRDVRMPLSPELMRRDTNTSPEMIKAQDEYYAQRDAMGDVTIGQDKTLAETEALRREKQTTAQKSGTTRIYDKKTGKILREIPSSLGTGDQWIPVGENDSSANEDKVRKRQDDAARQALNVVKNYYSSLKDIQGETIGAGESAKIGVAGLTSRIPVLGRAIQKDTSQLTGYRAAQGARLAGAMGDSGNKALAEQKNALELLAPPGTRDLSISQNQALATILEGIKNRTPEEESLYQQVVQSFNRTGTDGAVPQVGGTFNGEKVIRVRKVR
jgi:hypothetical protein